MDRVDGTVRDVFEGCLGYAQKASQKRNITATLAGFADASGFTEGGAPACVDVHLNFRDKLYLRRFPFHSGTRR